MSRDAIERLVHDYSDAVVHRDFGQWGSTWAPDGVWDLGKGRRVEGREAILEMWTGAMTRFTAVIQTVFNGAAELDEESGTGTGRWYILEAMQRSDGTNSMMLGHYDDSYVRVDGQWLFASRELTPHYQGPGDLSGDFHNAVTE
ncbi:MAG: nuclear transport factor 2 family protein [Acidimicrobiales bacterium]|jgi:uncharacterized protein (TIGR02246 family)|nr:nuclear transport factor 2 family protein [Acidimicrobiales bacterium]